MRTHIFSTLIILLSGSVGLLADDLTWGGTYLAAWQGFGTSPYTAHDTTTGQGIQIFCLDFNDEIAPPFDWTASINSLNPSNVATSAQYGGNYNNLLTAAFANPSNPKAPGESTAPQVAAAPFVFTGDTPPGGIDAVSLAATGSSAASAYTRYLEAAWLFTDIESAVAAHPLDVNTDMIAQVAAWDLFVNSSNKAQLANDINTFGGTFTFNNYLSWSGGNYNNPGSASTQATSGLTFEQAVDVALAAAQNAVVNEGWGPGSNTFGSWSLVTGTAAYVVGYGLPVQEFLSPNAVPDQPPVPEPQSVVLLGTVVIMFGIILRRGKSAKESAKRISA